MIKIVTTILLVCIPMLLPARLQAQGMRSSLDVNTGHLFSEWTLGDGVQAKVMLESGFPKIVIDKSFATKYYAQLGIGLAEAPANTYVALWGGAQKYPVTHTVDDSLAVNGVKLRLEALVVDFRDVNSPSWRSCDVVFPVADLGGAVEFNIKERYMRTLLDGYTLPQGFTSWNVERDKRTRGLCVAATLEVCDTSGRCEELTGDFLLDLGAGNALTLNKNRADVAEFTARCDRMLLKDTTRFHSNQATQLQIIVPFSSRLLGIETRGGFIPAMKLFHGVDAYAGLVGPRFFENSAFIFDFDRNKLYVKQSGTGYHNTTTQ